MDPSLIIGVGLALVAIVVSTTMEGGNIAAILMPGPMLLVFGGTIGAAVAGGIMRDAKSLVPSLMRAFTSKVGEPDMMVATLVHLAGRARREGLLALEDELENVDDPFLHRGLQLAIDGTDPEEVEIILAAEIDTKRGSDNASAKLFNDMGGYAPTIGIIGTVLGLVHVLGALSSPDKLGAEIASAFVATLWGVMTANVFWLPLASRVKRLSQVECDQMHMAMEGILALQGGANPRLLEQKLQSLIPATPAKQAEKEVA